MERNNNTLQITILVVLIVNLFVSLFILQNISSTKGVAESPQKVSVNLPEEIDKDERTKLIENFISAYNSDSGKDFENVFSEYSLAQIDPAIIRREYKKMREYIGNISKGVFSHYEFAGEKGNLKFYTLYYFVNMETSGVQGNKGSAIIGIHWDGENYGVFSANINTSPI